MELNPELNARKNRWFNFKGFFSAAPSEWCLFFNNRAHNAGVSVNALTAEMIIAMASV
ncbi:hypothetical protein D3C86_2031140 [compost metagenome]